MDNKLRIVGTRALEHYGEDEQMIQAHEELAELIVAISHKRRHRIKMSSVIKEVADVEIMIGQLKLLYNIENEVEDVRDRILDDLDLKMDEEVRRGKS